MPNEITSPQNLGTHTTGIQPPSKGRERILGVDPGDKHIGIAVSDELRVLARPVSTLVHQSREQDARRIVELADSLGAGIIVIGQTIDDMGEVSFEGRKSARLATAINQFTERKVVLWDESESTKTARTSRREIGYPKRKTRNHFDALAAVIILQSFLEELRIANGIPEIVTTRCDA